MGNYDKWKEEYYNLEKVDLNRYFSKEDFLILEKIGIDILDKVYTESEFELLYSKVILNYDENNKITDNIKNLDINQEEFDELVKKLDNINEIYDF